MAKEPANRPARSDEPSEYDEFESLTRKLVKVAKSEIDAERAKENGKKPHP